MRHRAAKQMLQHKMCHWQERLACWIKDKDKEKAGTENSLAAQVNLGWFHSRKSPGVCVQQISLQLGWKLSPARASPTSPFHSLFPIPGMQTHGGMVWWPKQPLGPHQNPRQGCHPKGSARRMRDLLCSVPALQGKTQGHIRDHLKKNLWGIAVLHPASTALQGTRRKFLHLPTSTAQFLQYLFAANPSITLALGLVFVELLQCIPLKA